MKVWAMHDAIKRALSGLNTGMQMTFYSVLLSHLTFIQYAYAGPTGGNVVGGAGNISQSGLNTTINQASQNMAIDWQSYNVNVDERVYYIQPNSSSVSLNRILSNTGSTIAGQIDANGHVILVNPNGVLFTSTAQLNVGGMIASGLDISSADFMNGDYIFNEVLGSEGAVINSGTINASLGGNVALLGRHVENNGLISAQLGSVNLAAGKQAVLTFDNSGLLGVRISREILQTELGVDAAVLNSGNIDAAGGRVLLTGSVSQDVFSQAVNNSDGLQAKSVVVNADGSFTLGAGADVLNSGNISVSSTDTAGQVVLLGENVSSSGSITADTQTANAGHIELHARDVTALTQNSVTTARAEHTGAGGDIKLLGDKVGLFDTSLVDASGAKGGGGILIGGDREGKNAQIDNASFVFIDNYASIKADALDTGNGGKLIAFAEDTTRIYGDLFARGGVNGGNGGFIETSGLKGFEINSTPDVSAIAGSGGEWLIDPNNISIVAGSGFTNINNTSPFVTTNDGASLGVGLIQNALTGGATVTITTGSAGTNGELGNIIFDAVLDYNGKGTNTLTLQANNNITFNSLSRVVDSTPSSLDSLNINLLANGSVSLADATVSIVTQGGNFNVGTTTNRVANFTNNGTVNTSGLTGCTVVGCVDGGNVSVYTTGNIITTGFDTRGESDNGAPDMGGGGGAVILNASGATSTLVLNSSINTSGGADNDGSSRIGGNAGSVALDALGGITLGTALVSANITANGGTANDIVGNGANISLTGPVVLANTTAMSATGATRGNISFSSTLNDNDSTPAPLTLTGRVVTFGGAVGTTQRLGALSINATSNITAATNNIIANSLAATQSTGFTSGDITTSSSTGNGGSISIASSGAVNVGSLNSSSTVLDGSGGTVVVGAGQITLNGDVNALGNGLGTSQTALLTLTSPGDLTINHNTNFSSAITLTGSTGTDTIIGANRTNTWTLTGGDSGTLNTNLTFSAMENLTGNAGQDIFNVANTGNFTGAINGGAGTSDEIRGGNRDNDWFITGANSGSVTGLSNAFSNIEVLTGNNGTDTFYLDNTINFAGSVNGGGAVDEVIGGDRANNWVITAANDGTVTGITGGFSNIEALTGGNNQDIFQLHDTINFAGSINGAGGSNDEVRGGNRSNSWAITNNNNTGTVTGLTGTFSYVELLTGNNGQDIFQLHASRDFDGSINGGAGTTDEVIGGSRANTWTITGTNNTGTVTGITGAGHTFSNVEVLTGNSNTDVFQLHNSIDFDGSINGAGGTSDEVRAGNRTNNWAITSNNNTGTVTGISGVGHTFSNVELLVGNNGTDIFQLHDTINFSGSVNGGSGTNDELRGGNRSINTWVINNANRGTVTGLTGSGDTFTSIENLTGGTGVDRFNYQAGSSISGAVNGGDNFDTVDQSLLANVNITLGASGFSNIEEFIGNSSATSTLTANATTENTWIIDSIYGGSVSDGITSTIFQGFQILNGGDLKDTFTLSSTITSINTGAGNDEVTVNAGGSVGTIHLGNGDDLFTINDGFVASVFGDDNDDTFVLNGGNITGGANNIVIDGGNGTDYAGYPGISPVNVGTTLTGLEGVNATNGAGTLVAQDGVTTNWIIDGVNRGYLTYGGQTLYFTGFSTLNGGSGTDNFTITQNIADGTTGSIATAGGLNGNGGTNTLTVELTGIEPGQVRYTGTTGNDSISVTGTTGNYDAAYTPGATIADYDQLVYTSGSNIPFTISYLGVDTVQTQHTLNSLTVNGTVASDAFNLGSGTSSSDTLFSVNTNTPVHFTNTAVSSLIVNGQSNDIIDIGSDFNLGSNNLRLIAGAITNSSNSTITANNLFIDSMITDMTGNRLLTNINDLSLVNTTGAVMMTDSGSLNISQIGNVNSLDLIANGDITTGSLNTAAALTLVSTTGDITLQNAAVTNIQGLSAQNLDINSTGAINGNGAMTVTGTTTLTSTDNITLGAANDFNVVNVVSANDVQINDVNNIALGSINATTVNINAGGAITDSNGPSSNVVADVVTLRAVAGIGASDAIETRTAELDVINTMSGDVNINNSGAVTLTNLVNQATLDPDNDITFNNDLDVTLDHVEADYMSGNVELTVTNGSIYGIMPRVDSNGNTVSFASVPDIKSDTAFITATQSFGTFTRPIVLDVRTQIDLIVPIAYQPVIYGDPIFNTTSDIQSSLLGSVGSISGQQLIELESLADIDPAIFTAVRTYNYDDISIRLPSDQLYDDDEEDKR